MGGGVAHGPKGAIYKTSKINKKVQIHISDDIPLKIQYGMDTFMDNDDDDDDDESDKNYIRFFLAPKIEDF